MATILPFGHCRLMFTPASAVSQTGALDASHKDGVPRTDGAGGRIELSDNEFRVRKPGNEAHVFGLQSGEALKHCGSDGERFAAREGSWMADLSRGWGSHA